MRKNIENKDIEKKISEIHEITIRNTRMLHAMRRSGIIRSTIFYGIIGISVYYGYSFYNTVRDTVYKTKTHITDTVGTATNVIKETSFIKNIFESL